jgi:hypothetical protein
MTLDQAFQQAYRVAQQNDLILLLGVGIALPLVATSLAWIGKGGKTDADGKFIASVLVGFGLLLVFLEIVAFLIAHNLYHVSILGADVALLATPPLCLLLSVAGVRLIFPLNQLASWRSFGDIAVFAIACAGVLWFFSKFRGWGIIFFGGFFQLIAVLVLVFFLLRRLYRRARGHDNR